MDAILTERFQNILKNIEQNVQDSGNHGNTEEDCPFVKVMEKS